MLRAHERWVMEYTHERLGKEAAGREAHERGIDDARINAVLWYPIAGFNRDGEPCVCKAQVWLNGVCLGCFKKKESDNAKNLD